MGGGGPKNLFVFQSPNPRICGLKILDLYFRLDNRFNFPPYLIFKLTDKSGWSWRCSGCSNPTELMETVKLSLNKSSRLHFLIVSIRKYPPWKLFKKVCGVEHQSMQYNGVVKQTWRGRVEKAVISLKWTNLCESYFKHKIHLDFISKTEKLSYFLSTLLD